MYRLDTGIPESVPGTRFKLTFSHHDRYHSLWYTPAVLNTECFHLPAAGQFPIENRLGNEDGREYIGHQADHQSHRETLYRVGSKNEQEARMIPRL